MPNEIYLLVSGETGLYKQGLSGENENKKESNHISVR